MSSTLVVTAFLSNIVDTVSNTIQIVVVEVKVDVGRTLAKCKTRFNCILFDFV